SIPSTSKSQSRIFMFVAHSDSIQIWMITPGRSDLTGAQSTGTLNRQCYAAFTRLPIARTVWATMPSTHSAWRMGDWQCATCFVLAILRCSLDRLDRLESLSVLTAESSCWLAY